MNTSKFTYLGHGLVAAVAVWGASNAWAADRTPRTDRTDNEPSATTDSTAPKANQLDHGANPAATSSTETALGKSSTRLEHKEAAFMKEAAQGGEAEVEMGKLAAEKGQNSQVKQLGERLQQDHSKANQELMQIAQKVGVALPSDTSRKENKMVSKLQDKTGLDFDKAFVEHALVDHEKDIRKFEKASQDCKDPELKAWIDKNLPALRQHLELARTAGSVVGVDQKYLTAADRFLSQQGSRSSTSSSDLNSSENKGLGTAPNAETGRGRSTTETSPSDQPK